MPTRLYAQVRTSPAARPGVEFLQTGLNELEQRAPLTLIRAFSEILLDDPKIELAQHNNFLGIIIKEALIASRT